MPVYPQLHVIPNKASVWTQFSTWV